MSEMKLQVAVRFLLIGDTSHLTRADLYELSRTLFKKEADDYYGDGEFYYFPHHNDGWTVNFVGNKMFLDYMIEDEDDCYDVDINIPVHGVGNVSLEEICAHFNDKFVGNVPQDMVAKFNLPLDTVTYSIRVLYFDNGGSAGLSEVV